METIRSFLSVVYGLFLSVAYPLFNPTIILGILFAFDVAAGIICDRIINSTGFSFRKFLRAMELLALYSASIFVMYIICYLQDDMEEGKILLKTITYTCSYFYLVNVFKNFKESYPGNRFFSFLYFSLSLEIITERIPALRLFLSKEKELVPENTNRYKSRDGVVEAIRLKADSDSIREVLLFIGQPVDMESDQGRKALETFSSNTARQGILSVRVNGNLFVCPLGDYMVKDKSGMVYPLKSQVFESKYRKL